MGCCNQKPTDARQANISQDGGEKPNEEKIFKLLLLGAGGSGKSTVFRQVRIMFGEGYDDDERQTLALTIHQNMVESIKRIVDASPKYGPIDRADLVAKVNKLPYDAPFKDIKAIGDLIAEVWALDGIKKTYAQRSKYQLPTDIIHYFFAKATDVMKEDYKPTDEDLLRCRIHSTGVKQEKFQLGDDVKFHLLDVGGQRNERKKWVRCFENVTAVLYVVAISEYDQLCYEDNETNRVQEALDLFEDITNSEWFADTPIILFLNKKDLLAEKLKTQPLKDFFTEYKPASGETYESAITFLKNEFDERNQQDREIISQVTCATNAADVKDVFLTHIKNILVKKKGERVM